MQADALVQINALVGVVVAALAATFIAISSVERGPIVACRYDSIVFYHYGSIAFLHTVRPGSCQLSQPHEIGIKAWPYQFLVVELELIQLTMEALQGVMDV